MYFSLLHGHGTSFWPGASGAPTVCMHGTTRLSSLSISRKHGSADARHDPHVDDDVRRVGQLHADLRHRRADRPHAERQHVHRAAAHAAVEQAPSACGASRTGSSQLFVGPAPSFESEQMKVRSSTRATSLGVGARVVTAGPKFFVELDEGAARDHLGIERSHLLRSRPPSEWRRAWSARHLLDPSQQVLVFAQRNCVVSMFHRRRQNHNRTRSPHSRDEFGTFSGADPRSVAASQAAFSRICKPRSRATRTIVLSFEVQGRSPCHPTILFLCPIPKK